MKKGIYTAVMLFWILTAVSAEQTSEVLLRYSRQDNSIRVVLESDENAVSNAKTMISAAGVKIAFSSAFELKKPQDFIFKTLKEAQTLMIFLHDVTDVRTYRLSAPARIVIEMKGRLQDTGQAIQTENAAKTEQKDPAVPSQETRPAVQLQSDQKAPESSKPQARPPKVSTVVIDPGHGGYDYGLYRQEIKEKEISLSIAKELAGILQKKGVKVFLTRKVDQSYALEDRINFSNSKAPDLFITIHATPYAKFVITTASADESASDAAIMPYRLSARQNRHIDKSRASAKALAAALKPDFKTEPAIRELPLPVLSSIDAAAVMLEYPLTDRNTYDQKERDRLISAIVKGLAVNE